MKNSILEKMLQNPSGIKLFMLNRILSFMIPFNAPHGFRILQMNEKGVSIKLPYKRKNLNHIKSVHACAIATVGEFCAGMSLLQHFPVSNYRLILSKLNSEYLYQGKTDLIGNVHAISSLILKTKREVEALGKSMIEMETTLTDAHLNVVAKVATVWQVKSWDRVQTKV